MDDSEVVEDVESNVADSGASPDAVDDGTESASPIKQQGLEGPASGSESGDSSTAPAPAEQVAADEQENEASEVVQTVAIDSDQWAYIQGHCSFSLYCSLLSALFCAFLCGAVLWSAISRR